MGMISDIMNYEADYNYVEPSPTREQIQKIKEMDDIHEEIFGWRRNINELKEKKNGNS